MQEQETTTINEIVEEETTIQEVLETETQVEETQEETATTTDLITYDTSVLVDINTNLENISYTLNCGFILCVGMLAAFIVYKFFNRLF